MADDDDDAIPDAAVLDAVGDLGAKLDTVAGALAAIASSHTDLLARLADAETRRTQDAQEISQRLEAVERQVLDSTAGDAPANGDPGQLAKLVEGIERLESRTEDRLAAVRDAAAAPVADLQALLQARADRDDRERKELADTLRDLAAEGPAAIRDQLAELREAVGELEVPVAAPDTSGPMLERMEELSQAIHAVTWQLPELGEELAALRERVEGIDLSGVGNDLSGKLTLHIDTALAGVLRLLDDRLATLRRAMTEAAGATPSNVGGFEAGAVMGAAQAAWNRLEQRLDTEFDDLGRQLQAMATLIEQVSANAEAAANRPVVTGDQLKRAASAVKDSVVKAGRTRREHRGGPRSLGPG
jgi:chromosome segregation ATPase